MQRSLSIDEAALERIMQAALFYAEVVTLRASATVPSSSGRVRRRINELIEIGAVQTWAHEYELSRTGRPSAGGRTISAAPPHHVVPMETTRRFMLEIDDELAENRGLAYDGGPALREGVSEVVQLRHSMSTLRLADALGANGVLAGERESSPTIQAIERATRPADPHEAIVSEVVGHCSFGRLAHLPMEAVAECRLAMPQFRDLLCRRIAAQQVGGVSASPSDLAGMILAEYRKVRVVARDQPGSVNEGATWDVVGAVLPHAVIAKAMGKRIEWFRYRGKSRPFMLLGTLRRYASSDVG